MKKRMRRNKMANYYTANAIINYLQNSEVVESFKVTKVEILSFNQIEGLKYLVNISVKTQDGYKDKRLKMLTNSTYLEEFTWDEKLKDEENFSEWLKQSVGF